MQNAQLRRIVVFLTLFTAVPSSALAGAGPLGIDHRLPYDNSGIWARKNQKALITAMIASEAIGGLWEGGKTRLGRTFWRAIDSSVLAGGTAQVLKFAFTRARPAQTDDPNKWFQGGHHYSFPSGEVTAVTSIVTPFILEYRKDNPWVYGLELLPVYDAEARMKVWGHWQTDVLAGWALGTLGGYLAMKPTTPVILSVLPDGVSVGLRYRF